MTSEIKRAANRRNSLRSTGPRSPSGKAASSRNALRHGLAVPLAALPEGDHAVDALLAELVEPTATPQIRYHSRVFAESTVELWRIANLRAYMIKVTKEETTAFHQLALDGEDVDFLEPFRSTVEELNRVDRYERRALSRRRKALMELAHLC